ncbi:hypothetical protein KP509_17G061800 [Ceratopteris richardii]|uniref:Uncharacterized protein n=1 Tax=Ceratopteris richardii TaxID=49495 RepID=A0A8T2SYA5_CERRI|nr:hypothetical protein KP509_17G061800 [Ceratopteris richardii]
MVALERQPEPSRPMAGSTRRSTSPLTQLLSSCKVRRAEADGEERMLVTVSWMGSLIWEVRVVMNVHETVSGLLRQLWRRLLRKVATSPPTIALSTQLLSPQSR